MKKILFIGSLIFLFIGCAAVKQAKQDAASCLADPVCREAAVAEARNEKEIATAIAGASPIPLSANIVGGAVYGIGLVVALIRKGRKKRLEAVPAVAAADTPK